MWFIQKSEILSLLPVDELCDILEIFSDHQPIKKRTIIYQPSDSSEYVYLLKKGRVRLMQVGENGNQITFSIIVDGMIFGESDVLNEKQYSHYAETLESSTICYIRKQDFKALLNDYPKVNQKITSLLYQRWREATQQLEDLALKDVRVRLINLLLRFNNQFGKPLHTNDTSDDSIITVKITQDEIANFIGTTRETVNRIFKDLRNRNLIDLKGKNIILRKGFFENSDVYEENVS